MKKNNIFLEVILVLSLVLIPMSYTINGIGYLRYVSVIPLAFFLGKRLRKGYLLKTLQLFIVFVLFGFFITIFSFNISFRLFFEIILILLPILYVILFDNIQKIQEKHILYYFLISVFFIFVQKFNALFNLLINPMDLIIGLKTSQLDTESHLGFLFGLFFLYFILNKSKKRYSIVSFILMIITLKRIVIGAAVLSLIIYLILISNKRNKEFYRNLNLLLFFCLVLFVYVLINLSLGNYDEWIKFNTGMSANHFTMGRAYMYGKVLNEMPIQLFGYGQGTTTVYLDSLGIENMNRLHSDLLKNFIEIGVFIYIFWIIIFNRLNIFSLNSFIILIYYWIVLATDNAFIYFDFLVLFYMIQSSFYDQRSYR